MLTHLLDERTIASVKRSGIKGAPAVVASGTGMVSIAKAVFAMPVLPNYFASHQWLRELKRRGMRTVAAVHFRMRSDTNVWVGKYNGEHRNVPLGHAAGLIMREADPRGWQIVVAGSVPAKSVHAVRTVPQVIGWRYFPESRERGPWKCLCDACLRGLKGEVKSRALVERLLRTEGAERLNVEGDATRLVRRRRKR